MVKLFRQSGVGQIMVIFLALAALWAPAFITPVSVKPSEFFSPLYELVYRLVFSQPRIASTIALILIIVQGIGLNIMLYNHKMIPANTLMPMFIYIIAMSWSRDLLTITPMLFVNMMMLPICHQLLSDGTTKLGFERNFNSAFCIGIASLFYLPTLCLIVPFLFVFIIYKLYRWRDIIIAILGLIAPFIVLFTYAFLTDKLDYFMILIRHDISDMDFTFDFSNTLSTICCAAFLLLLLMSLFHQLGTQSENVNIQRINTSVMVLPLIASVLMSMYTCMFPFDTQLMAPWFAFLATLLILADRKRKWISEVMIWIFVLCATINIWII